MQNQRERFGVLKIGESLQKKENNVLSINRVSEKLNKLLITFY